MVKLLIEAGALLNDEGMVFFCYRIFLISFPQNFITPTKDVHGKTPLDYALEGGNGKVATLFQELQNVDAASREKPKAIDTELVDGFDFPDEVPDFLSDANVSFGYFCQFFYKFLGDSGKN